MQGDSRKRDPETEANMEWRQRKWKEKKKEKEVEEGEWKDEEGFNVVRSIYQSKSSLGLFCFASFSVSLRPLSLCSSVLFLYSFVLFRFPCHQESSLVCPVPLCQDDALHVAVFQTGEVTLAEMVRVDVGEEQEENNSRIDLNDPGSETETLFIR